MVRDEFEVCELSLKLKAYKSSQLRNIEPAAMGHCLTPQMPMARRPASPAP